MTIDVKIKELASKFSSNLKKKIDQRVIEMESDDDSHRLIYQVLGVTKKEGNQIDVYQNKGRFLYKYAGSFLEEATKLCFLERFEGSGSVRIENTEGLRPKTFEIDCLVDNEAIEIKWRDATTDGDHITKEHTRMRCVANAGYQPIRVMFFYPNRAQAIRIQQTLETLYVGAGGEYHYGDSAWDFVKRKTGIDLFTILKHIAAENIAENMIIRLIDDKGINCISQVGRSFDEISETLAPYGEAADIFLIKESIENGLNMEPIVKKYLNE